MEREPSAAEALIAKKFGKDKLTLQVAELCRKDILGADGEAHLLQAAYRPDEPRYMRRVQVMATRDYARLAA